MEDVFPAMYEMMIRQVLQKYAEREMVVRPMCAPSSCASGTRWAST